MPDTETPRAGTRGRRIARSPPALQESRSRQRQDRRPLFPSRPPPAAHARRHPGPDGPVPARRGPQRALPQAWAPAYRRGVGLGPRTRRPGADTPRAVVPPSPGTKAAPLPCIRNSALRRSGPGIPALEYWARRCRFDRREIVAQARGANGRPENQAMPEGRERAAKEVAMPARLAGSQYGILDEPCRGERSSLAPSFGRFVTLRTNSEIGGLTICNERRN